MTHCWQCSYVYHSLCVWAKSFTLKSWASRENCVWAIMPVLKAALTTIHSVTHNLVTHDRLTHSIDLSQSKLPCVLAMHSNCKSFLLLLSFTLTVQSGSSPTSLFSWVWAEVCTFQHHERCECTHLKFTKQTNKQAYTQCSHAGVGVTQAHPNKPVYIDVIFILGIRTNSKYQLRM